MGALPLRVCVVEPSAGSLSRRLREAGVHVELHATDPEALSVQLDQRIPQLAVVDAAHVEPDRVRAFTHRHPGVRVVAVAPAPSAPMIARMKAAGAWDCVARPTGHARGLAQLLEATLGARGVGEGLTVREREVLGQVAQGCDNLQIAALLGITERTVKAHVGNLYRKLGAQNRVALALAGARP